MTAPTDPAARDLSVIRLFAILAILGLATLALRAPEQVHDWPLTEDGYYSLSVARNLAAGHGLTIDGRTLTNGFQPLFTVLEAGAFALAGGDEGLALRFVMVLAWLFHAGGAAIIGLVARDAWPARFGAAERARRFWLAALLYLTAPLILSHAYNGLETGCVMFFYALAARVVQIGADRSRRGLVLLGAIVGLLVLARIDAAFFAVALGLNELRRARTHGVATMLGRGVLLAGVALAVSAPWWLYNLVYFGSPMPTSGTAQQSWALEWLRLELGEWALALAGFPWLFLPGLENRLAFQLPWPFGEAGYMTVTAAGIVRTLAVAIGLMALYRSLGRGRARAEIAAATGEDAARVRRTLEFAACFGLAFVALVLYYVLSFIAFWFYYRYFAPLALVAVVVAAVAWARWAAALPPSARGIGSVALAGVLVLQLFGFVALAQIGRGFGVDTVYHDQVALVRAHVPDGEFVAAGQSGTLGFFRDRVVNTDGKVNRDALAWQDRMTDYLRARGVRWFVDWPHYVQKYIGVPIAGPGDRPAAEANGWRLVAERNYFFLYEYVGPAAAR
ncbi:MAG: hypothetical protein HY057_11115 [Rhodospirillales bacterium]|nr:hypothetical protein [Rhodospirillales bacterium]